MFIIVCLLLFLFKNYELRFYKRTINFLSGCVFLLLSLVIDVFKKNILIVDDNKLNADVTKMLLDGLYSTHVCYSAQESIDFVSEGLVSIDAILIDIVMSGKSGVDAAQEIGNMYISQDLFVPIIALTAEPNYYGIEESNPYFVHSLLKPVSQKVLKDTIDFYINEFK